MYKWLKQFYSKLLYLCWAYNIWCATLLLWFVTKNESRDLCGNIVKKLLFRNTRWHVIIIIIIISSQNVAENVYYLFLVYLTLRWTSEPVCHSVTFSFTYTFISNKKSKRQLSILSFTNNIVSTYLPIFLYSNIIFYLSIDGIDNFPLNRRLVEKYDIVIIPLHSSLIAVLL